MEHCSYILQYEVNSCYFQSRTTVNIQVRPFNLPFPIGDMYMNLENMHGTFYCSFISDNTDIYSNIDVHKQVSPSLVLKIIDCAFSTCFILRNSA